MLRYRGFWGTAALFAITVLGGFLRPVSADEARDVERAIEIVGQVGAEGAGSAAARAARDELAECDGTILPRLLIAMDTPNLVAANWYRTAFDAIATRELARAEPRLPQAALAQYVADPQRSGRARRLGLDLLERLEPGSRDRLLAGWLDDPEFRRDAVAEALADGERAKQAGQTEAAERSYRQAFVHARDSDQVLEAVGRLASVGHTADPISHLGFVTRWWLLGPFSAPGTTGFAATFPPEEQLDVQNLQAEYIGADQQPARWKLHQTPDRLGEINLITVFGPVREVVAYAYAEIEAPRDQEVRLACSADDNLTVWLNGEKVLAREQWLNGTRLDRFMVPVTLSAGSNRVLVKICQGPKHVNPEVPNNWSFQLRFCDATGGAAPFTNLVPATP